MKALSKQHRKSLATNVDQYSVCELYLNAPRPQYWDSGTHEH
jgi:hypothetical protein